MTNDEKIALLREAILAARKEILGGSPNYSFESIIAKLNNAIDKTS